MTLDELVSQLGELRQKVGGDAEVLIKASPLDHNWNSDLPDAVKVKAGWKRVILTSESVDRDDYPMALDCLTARERTFYFEFMYPRCEGQIDTLDVGLLDVRASDGIRVKYDFDRDGYQILQPRPQRRRQFEPGPNDKVTDRGGYTSIEEAEDEWVETVFVQSWALYPEGYFDD